MEHDVLFERVVRQLLSEAAAEFQGLDKEMQKTAKSLVGMLTSEDLSNVSHALFTLDSLGDPALSNAVYGRLGRKVKNPGVEAIKDINRSVHIAAANATDPQDKELAERLGLRVLGASGAASLVSSWWNYIVAPTREDLADFGKMSNLQEFTASGGDPVEIISALPAPQKMKNVDFMSWDSPDMSALAPFTGLEILFIRDCSVLTSLDGIQGMTKLRNIVLRNATSLTDLTAFAKLPNLVGYEFQGSPAAPGKKSTSAVDGRFNREATLAFQAEVAAGTLK